MTAEKFDQLPMRRAVLAGRLARLVGQPRFKRWWEMPLLHRFAGRKAMQRPDPVLLAVFGAREAGQSSAPEDQ